MAIIDETGQAKTITEGGRDLDLFTDRHELIRLFSSYLNDDPPRKEILFFHGDGGNGKSLLLSALRTQMNNTEGTETIPSAFLDFGMQPRCDDYPQEPFSALAMLWRTLAAYGLRFPLYGFACTSYLRKTKKLDRLKNISPAEEMDFVSAIVDATSGGVWGTLAKSVLNIFGKHLHLSESFTLYMQRRGLTPEQVEDIERMDAESTLIDNLPHLFAKDLNAAMGTDTAPKRVVLFFDTHEAFWGHQRDLSDHLFFQRDEWLRRLLGSLEPRSGIVVVLAGREPPRWAEDWIPFRIPEECIDVQLVGHLSYVDADEYLRRAEIADAAMRQRLVAYARAKPEQVHPYLLALCADVVLAALGKGKILTPEDFQLGLDFAQKGKRLVQRLLSYVDKEIEDAVKALSVCRAFDETIYFTLGESQSLKFRATRAGFKVLTGFSFVERLGHDRYRIYALLRRFMRELEDEDEVASKADKVLENYYRARGEEGDISAVLETIYHANRLDWKRGATDWVKTFERALKLSHFELCRALLDVRMELSINEELERGQIANCAADYFACLSRYAEAKQEYLDAIQAFEEALHRKPDDADILNKRAIALRGIGELAAELSQFDQAAQNYKQAIACFDQALAHAPDDVGIRDNKGWALMKRGDLEAELSQYEQAAESYRLAVAAFEDALQRAPDYVDAHANKGYALMSLADSQAKLSLHQQAAENYGQAISTLDDALHHSPDYIDVHVNRGYALMSRGELEAELSQYEQAAESYQLALAALEEAVHRAPDDVTALNNKGYALMSRGELQAELSQYEQAAESYRLALTALEDAMHPAPDDVTGLKNKAYALMSRGGLEAELSQWEQAAESYQLALAALEEALHRAPDDVTALNNKGYALMSRGELQAELSQYEQAPESYRFALAALEEALRRAPDDLVALNKKGRALTSQGKLQTQLSQYQPAAESYSLALAALEQALRRAPNDVTFLANKGCAFTCQGELQAELSQIQPAAESYKQAVTTFEHALQIAPQRIDVNINRARVFARLGVLQTASSRDEEARDSYEQAVRAGDKVLLLAPDHVEALVTKGHALRKVAELHVKLAQYVEANDTYKQAIAVCDEALRGAPRTTAAHREKGAALLSLGELLAGQPNRDLAVQTLHQALAEVTRSLAIAPNDRKIFDLQERIAQGLDKVL